MHIFRIFGCAAYVHVNTEVRDSTLAEKAYQRFFVGLKWPHLDQYLVFVLDLHKVVESAHVLFDEVSKPARRSEELLTVDPEKKSVTDFECLSYLAYTDDENNILYVTTSRGFVVAFRAPIIGGTQGVISMEHVDTLRNVADIFTKALGRVKFEPLRDIAMEITDIEHQTKRRKTESSDEFV